jgi:hypothetical protein
LEEWSDGFITNSISDPYQSVWYSLMNGQNDNHRLIHCDLEEVSEIDDADPAVLSFTVNSISIQERSFFLVIFLLTASALNARRRLKDAMQQGGCTANSDPNSSRWISSDSYPAL